MSDDRGMEVECQEAVARVYGIHMPSMTRLRSTVVYSNGRREAIDWYRCNRCGWDSNEEHNHKAAAAFHWQHCKAGESA